MTPEQFRQDIAELTTQLVGRPLDAGLDQWLNSEHGKDSATYARLRASCEAGVAQGWLVCPPGSAHRPTVRLGRALVLYLLPQGRIEFSATPA